MTYVLDALAMRAHVIVAPHRCEFGAELAGFVDERPHLRRRPCAERADDEARHAFPIILGGAHARIEEDETRTLRCSGW